MVPDYFSAHHARNDFIMIYAFIAIGTFLLMEGVTWLTHRFVMHGFLWYLHEDHHRPGKGFFEKNDWFFVIFAIPSMLLMWFGTHDDELFYLLFIGIGITAYGFAYFVVHEIIIHQRFRLFTRSTNFYVRAIRKAHKMHHKHLGKEEGECFGMLWVPVKYFSDALKYKQS
jgi:beta-carotene 3-hydroxylase